MRCFLAFAILIGIVSTGFAQVAKFRVVVGGRELGTATYSSSLSKNKDLHTKFQLKLKVGSNEASMYGEYMTRSDGAPLWTVSRETSREGTETFREDYGRNGVTVRKTAPDGKVTVKTIKYPKGPYKSASDFWFITTRPRPGTVEKAYSFTGTDMTWQQTTTTYVGMKSILVKGKSVRAHLITSTEVDIWVDAKGMPLKILLRNEGVELLLERV